MDLECETIIGLDLEDGTAVECFVTYEISFDADPYQHGCQESWNHYYLVEITSKRFFVGGVLYIPTLKELRDWSDEIEAAVNRDAKRNVERRKEIA